MANDHKWLYARIGLVTVGGLSGISITSPEVVAKSNVDWSACVVLFLVCPFMLLFVVGIQAVNPLSAAVWRKPSWYINPFLVKEPLQFFHLAAFHFMVGGLVGIATLPFRSASAAPLAISLLSIGAGVWLGVGLCMLVFSKKMEKG